MVRFDWDSGYLLVPFSQLTSIRFITMTCFFGAFHPQPFRLCHLLRYLPLVSSSFYPFQLAPTLRWSSLKPVSKTSLPSSMRCRLDDEWQITLSVYLCPLPGRLVYISCGARNFGFRYYTVIHLVSRVLSKCKVCVCRPTQGPMSFPRTPPRLWAVPAPQNCRQTILSASENMPS